MLILLDAREDHRKQIEAVLGKLEPRQGAGRPKGRTKYFRDIDDFRETMNALIQKAHCDGKDSSQGAIAEMLAPSMPSNGRRAMSSVDVSLSSTKRHIQRCMKDYGYTWKRLKILAGVPR